MKARRCLNAMIATFSSHFADPLVTEVVVNKPGQYGVERAGRWTWYDAPELTFERLDAIGIAAAAETSQPFSHAYSTCGSKLPGDQRIQINRPPATHDGIITMSVRRPLDAEQFIDDDDFGDMTRETNLGEPPKRQASDRLLRLFDARQWGEFCKVGIEERMTFGIVGHQNSGKTTMLKRFMRHIPQHHRTITVEEDSPEFGDAGPENKAAFFYGRPGLSAEIVLKAALRMRADRLIFQEVRGPEAFYFRRGLIMGSSGMTTWHAEFGKEFEALASMIRQSDAGRAIPNLVEELREHIDIIVWVHHDALGHKFPIPRIWFRGAEKSVDTGMEMAA